MPHDLPTRPTCFVFAPALYPESPFNGRPGFVHGIVREIKKRNGETIIRAQDEKGEWEAYAEHPRNTATQAGQKIRGFGIIERQPDGKTVLAARWVKEVDEKEYAFCERETKKEWEKIVQEYPALPELKPYTPPKNKPLPPTAGTTPPKSHTQSGEFVSANELKVERDFV